MNLRELDNAQTSNEQTYKGFIPVIMALDGFEKLTNKDNPNHAGSEEVASTGIIPGNERRRSARLMNHNAQTYRKFLCNVKVENEYESLVRKPKKKKGKSVDPFSDEVDVELTMNEPNQIEGEDDEEDFAGFSKKDVVVAKKKLKQIKKKNNEPQPDVAKSALRKLPPIVIHEAKFEEIMEKFDREKKMNFAIKWGEKAFKIIPNNYQSRERIMIILKESNVEFFSWTEKALKQRIFVLRGLPAYWDEEKVHEAIAELKLKEMEIIGVERMWTKYSFDH